MLDRVTDWRNFLDIDLTESTKSECRMHGRRSRPLGDEIFLENIERIAGRTLRPQKPGRKKTEKQENFPRSSTFLSISTLGTDEVNLSDQLRPTREHARLPVKNPEG